MLDFLKGLVEVLPAVVATGGAALPALGVGMVLKHGDKIPILNKVTKLVPNGALPALMPVIGTMFAQDPVTGTAAGVGANWVHQVAKVAIRAVAEKVAPTPGRLQNAIGPGRRLSI